MITLNEAAYNILNILRGGLSSNNDPLSIDQVKFIIKYYRSLLIRRSKRNLRSLRDLEQEITVLCSDYTAVDSESHPLIPDSITMVRSTNQLPKRVSFALSDGITFVGSAKGNVPFPLVHRNRAQWLGFAPVGSTYKVSFIVDEYLHVTQESGTNVPILVRGVFENPEEAFNYGKDVTTDTLWDDDVNLFPISMDMLQAITQSIINGEGRVLLGTNTDNIEDSVQN